MKNVIRSHFDSAEVEYLTSKGAHSIKFETMIELFSLVVPTFTRSLRDIEIVGRSDGESKGQPSQGYN